MTITNAAEYVLCFHHVGTLFLHIVYSLERNLPAPPPHDVNVAPNIALTITFIPSHTNAHGYTLFVLRR
jgi:hypothetical protein